MWFGMAASNSNSKQSAHAVHDDDDNDSTVAETTTLLSSCPAKHDAISQVDAYRICVFVEPSPFTYVSGYANRYKELFRHLESSMSNANHLSSTGLPPADPSGRTIGVEQVEIVTTEVVIPKDERPKSAFGFPIHYTRGLRLFCYQTMSVSFDWTLQAIRTVRRMKPNVIHCSSPGFMVFPAIICSKLYNIPLVLSYHTHIPAYVRSYMPAWIATLLVRVVWMYLWLIHYCCADLTLVTSPQLQQEFLDNCGQFHPNSLQVWQKGIDTVKFNPHHYSANMRKQRLCPKYTNSVSLEGSKVSNDSTKPHEMDEVLLLYVGRLATEKRVHELKDVMDKLIVLLNERDNINTLPSIRLALVGTGPQQAYLQTLFESLVDAGHVVLVGELHDDELSQAYASADIFVFPSASETLGFVIMEAMASGLPVVAADAGGIPNMVVPNESGHLVQPGDTNTYARRIFELVVDSSKREKMGDRGRQLTEEWSWESSMSKLLQEQYPLAFQNHFKGKRHS